MGSATEARLTLRKRTELHLAGSALENAIGETRGVACGGILEYSNDKRHKAYNQCLELVPPAVIWSMLYPLLYAL